MPAPPPEIAFQDRRRPAYNEEGVDLSLIRWCLSLTPAERLRHMRSRAAQLLRMQQFAAESRRRDSAAKAAREETVVATWDAERVIAEEAGGLGADFGK